MWLERGSDMVYKDAQLTRYSLRHNQQRQRFGDMVHEHNGIICALCTKKYSAASGMLYKVAAHHRHDSHSRDIVPLAPIRRDFSTTSSSLNTPLVLEAIADDDTVTPPHANRTHGVAE